MRWGVINGREPHVKAFAMPVGVVENVPQVDITRAEGSNMMSFLGGNWLAQLGGMVVPVFKEESFGFSEGLPILA